MEIVLVTVIVLLAVGLTARSLYYKLSNRSSRGECGEGCPMGTDCRAVPCEPGAAPRKFESPERAKASGRSESAPR